MSGSDQAVAQRSAVITPHIARTMMWHLGLWQEGDQSHPPSEWRRLLYRLIDKSDPGNLHKLAQAFPGEVAAYRLVTTTPKGAAVLRAIANNNAEASDG